ncbi:MAG: PAS domain S-box protein [Bacteroidales bacterium]|nr:PAS domain S-box protein [Bacteroidales bacterium]
MKTSDILLFYTGELDFKYLESQIDNYGFKAFYTDDEAEFTNLCLEKKFDLIIFNACEREGIESGILQGLTGTKNLYTPVMLIAGKDDKELMDIALKHHFDLIIFPFTPGELLIRLQMAVRRKDTEMTIHNKLIDYNVLFENFPAGILQIDVSGNFLRFNKELKKILGMNDIDFSGINFFQLCHPDDYLIQRQSLDRMLRKELDIVTYEIRMINNDGRTIVCRIKAAIVWKDQETLGSFIFSIEETG